SRTDESSGSRMVSYSASPRAATSDAVLSIDVTKGGHGLDTVSSRIRYCSAATGENFSNKPQVTLSIEQTSMVLSARYCRLVTCAPVTTTEEKRPSRRQFAPAPTAVGSCRSSMIG